MFKKFLTKKVLQSQLKNVPADQQEQILKAVESNPELFQKIAQEVEQKTKEGKPQQAAMMEVMKAHQDELKKALGQ